MTRLRLVQFWTTAETTDNERLDSDILILRKRVWERACSEVKRDERGAMLRNVGAALLVLCACALYIFIIGTR